MGEWWQRLQSVTRGLGAEHRGNRRPGARRRLRAIARCAAAVAPAAANARANPLHPIHSGLMPPGGLGPVMEGGSSRTPSMVSCQRHARTCLQWQLQGPQRAPAPAPQRNAPLVQQHAVCACLRLAPSLRQLCSARAVVKSSTRKRRPHCHIPPPQPPVARRFGGDGLRSSSSCQRRRRRTQHGQGAAD